MSASEANTTVLCASECRECESKPNGTGCRLSHTHKDDFFFAFSSFFFVQTHTLITTFQVRKAVLVDRYLYRAPPTAFPWRFFARTQSQMWKNNFETLHTKRGLQKAIMAATDQLANI